MWRQIRKGYISKYPYCHNNIIKYRKGYKMTLLLFSPAMVHKQVYKIRTLKKYSPDNEKIFLCRGLLQNWGEICLDRHPCVHLWISYDWTLANWTISSIGLYCLNQQATKEDKIAVHWCVEKATILSVLLPADMTNRTKTREKWNGKYVSTARNPQAKIVIQMSVEL